MLHILSGSCNADRRNNWYREHPQSKWLESDLTVHERTNSFEAIMDGSREGIEILPHTELWEWADWTKTSRDLHRVRRRKFCVYWFAVPEGGRWTGRCIICHIPQTNSQGQSICAKHNSVEDLIQCPCLNYSICMTGSTGKDDALCSPCEAGYISSSEGEIMNYWISMRTLLSLTSVLLEAVT